MYNGNTKILKKHLTIETKRNNIDVGVKGGKILYALKSMRKFKFKEIFFRLFAQKVSKFFYVLTVTYITNLFEIFFAL